MPCICLRRYLLIAIWLSFFLFQGLHSSKLDELLESSWTWMIKFKDEICSVAFKVGISAFSNFLMC